MITAQKIGAALALLLALTLGVKLWPRLAPYAGGSDSSGYLMLKKQILELRLLEPFRYLRDPELNYFPDQTWRPLAFRLSRNPDFIVSVYPLGLPLYLAAFELTFGSHGVELAMTALVAGLVLLTYFWLTQILRLEVAVGLVAAVAFALSPLHIINAISMMSDEASLFWVAAAGFAAWKMRDDRSQVWAALAGLATAWAVLTRPTNVIIVPLLLPLFLRRWKFFAAYLAGGLPGGIFWLLANRAMYGSFLTVGYVNHGQLFQRYYFWPNLLYFFRQIYEQGTALMLAAPLGLIFFPALRRNRRMAWIVALLLEYLILYCFYRHTGESWWYQRFIFPTYWAAYILAAAGIGAGVNWGCKKFRLPSALAWILVFIFLVRPWGRQQLEFAQKHDVWMMRHYGVVHEEGAKRIAELAAPNAVVVCMQTSASLYYYTPLTPFRYDRGTGRQWQKTFSVCRREKIPLWALVFDWELPHLDPELELSRWKQRDKIDNLLILQRDFSS